MKLFLSVIGIIVLILFISYFVWQIKRKINYNFSYKDMVVETIKETVKSECLKNK